MWITKAIREVESSLMAMNEVFDTIIYWLYAGNQSLLIIMNPIKSSSCDSPVDSRTIGKRRR